MFGNQENRGPSRDGGSARDAASIAGAVGSGIARRVNGAVDAEIEGEGFQIAVVDADRRRAGIHRDLQLLG